MTTRRVDLLQGTLDLLILRAIREGRKHGYDVLLWLERATAGALRIEEGALYPALHRLEARGWIASEWGRSDSNRRARFYRLTPEGQRRLKREQSAWRRYVGLVDQVLESK